MEFKSQICTTIEQSKRLLELGLNPETADMFHVFDYTIWHINGILELVHPNQLEETDVPAWSLHRLIELCPEYINIDGHADTTYWFKMYKLDNKIIYENDYNRWIYLGDGDNLFDTLIDCIDWAINNKHFNMNYLN